MTRPSGSRDERRLQPDGVRVLVWWNELQRDYATPDALLFAEEGVPLHVGHLASLFREDER